MSEEKITIGKDEFKTVIDVDTSLTVTYSQDQDGSVSRENDDFQFLEMEIANNGGGNYFVMKTERWAFDKTSDLEIILKDFLDKINKLKIENNG